MDQTQRKIDDFFNSHSELQILKDVIQLSNISAWLVGGSLRDLLLQRPVVDVDIAVAGNPTTVARSWSQQVNGRWFWLDSERLQSRVLLPNRMTVDFTPLRAASIAADQALRDFTINSLAVPLSEDSPQPILFDPLGGLQHLEMKSLQFCSQRSVTDDPLRMLKGIRHAVTLQMVLNDQALQLISQQAPSIKSVSAERVRDEIGKILSSSAPAAGVKLLYQTGLLGVLFGPENPGWDAEQTFADLAQLDRQMRTFENVSESGTGFEESFSSRALFLLATLLRKYAPNDLPDLLHNKLRLSRQQQRILISLQQAPEKQWFSLAEQLITARQKALLVEQLGYFPDEQLLYWAVSEQLISFEKAEDLLLSFHEQQSLGRVPGLLDGNQLRDYLSVQSEKEIGVWQQRLKAAELSGEITNETEALSWLKSKISD